MKALELLDHVATIIIAIMLTAVLAVVVALIFVSFVDDRAARQETQRPAVFQVEVPGRAGVTVQAGADLLSCAVAPFDDVPGAGRVITGSWAIYVTDFTLRCRRVRP